MLQVQSTGEERLRTTVIVVEEGRNERVSRMRVFLRSNLLVLKERVGKSGGGERGGKGKCRRMTCQRGV